LDSLSDEVDVLELDASDDESDELSDAPSDGPSDDALERDAAALPLLDRVSVT
jgi:hypothetical protein